jgi:hypothetical protein
MSGLKQSPGGLFFPAPKRHVTIIFRAGARLSIESTECEPVLDANGKLIDIKLESRSALPYIDFGEVAAIEVTT